MALFTQEELDRINQLNDRDRQYVPTPPAPSAPSGNANPYTHNPDPPSPADWGGVPTPPSNNQNPYTHNDAPPSEADWNVTPTPPGTGMNVPVNSPGYGSGPSMPYAPPPGMKGGGADYGKPFEQADLGPNPIPAPPQMGAGNRPGLVTNPNQQNSQVIKDGTGKVIGVVLPGGQFISTNPAVPGVPTPPQGGLSFGQGMNGGVPAPGVPTPPVPVSTPRDMNAINQYAENQVGSRVDAATRARDLATGNLTTQAGQLTTQLNSQAEQQRTRLAATREQALKGLSTGYGQAQQGITDQRNLQNVDMQRQGVNPAYSGADAYKQAMLAREREITDKQNAQIYNNQVGSLQQDYQNNITGIEQDISNRTAKIQQDLQMNQANVQKAWQDVANAAPAEKERLIKEATDQERAYQLALRNADRDDVLTQLQAKKTEMEQTRLNQDVLNQDRNYDLNLNDQKYNQQYKTDTLTEQKKQNNIDNAMKLGQQYGVGVLPKESGQALFEQVAGLPTVQAQQLAQEAERFGLEYALKKATQEHAISQDAADLVLKQAQVNISQQNANTASANAGRSATNDQQDTLYKQWQYTGKAPAGIPGVQPGTPYRTEANNGNSTTSYKSSPEFASDMQYLTQNKDRAVSLLQQNAQQFITKYGYDGYQALLKAAQE